MTLVDNRQKATISSLVSNGFSMNETLHLKMESGLTQANFISEDMLNALRKALDCYDSNGVFVRQFTDHTGKFSLYAPEAIIGCTLDDNSVLIRVNDAIVRMPGYKHGMKYFVENTLALHEILCKRPLLFANGTPFKMFDDGRQDAVEHLRGLARDFGLETEYLNDMNSGNYCRRKLNMQHFFAAFLCLSIEFGISPRKWYYTHFMTGGNYSRGKQTSKFNPLADLKETKPLPKDMAVSEWYKQAREAKKNADLDAKERRQAERKKGKQAEGLWSVNGDQRKPQKSDQRNPRNPRNSPPTYTDTVARSSLPSYAATKPRAPLPTYAQTGTTFSLVEEDGRAFTRYHATPKQNTQQKGAQQAAPKKRKQADK